VSGTACGGSTPYCSGGACTGLPKCATGPIKAIIYGPIGADEQAYLPTGAVVTVADGATWSASTTADFAKYNLIIIGESRSTTTTSTYDIVNASKATWGAAVTGPVVVTMLDPIGHISSRSGAPTFLKAALAWAGSGGSTGLYVGTEYGSRKMDFLSSFGSWTVLSQTIDGIAGDDVHVVATTHPTMAGSTDASLSSWAYSYHGAITAFPTGFAVAANVLAKPGAAVVVVRDVACAP
jgi:hypothetical protein